MLPSLLATFVFVASIGYSESCSCVKMHKQYHYCNADFVLQVKVRDEEIIYQKREVEENDPITRKIHTKIIRQPVARNYNMRIRKVFKIKENKLGLSRNSTVVTMQTPYHDATCGVVLKTKEKYITAGHFYDDQLTLNLCGWVEPWSYLTKVQKRNLRSLYETNCDCQVANIRADNGHLHKSKSELCVWDGFSDDGDCYDHHSACVHDKNSVLGECKWHRNIRVKNCRKEVKRRRWEP